jgi:hypothetical protein
MPEMEKINIRIPDGYFIVEEQKEWESSHYWHKPKKSWRSRYESYDCEGKQPRFNYYIIQLK